MDEVLIAEGIDAAVKLITLAVNSGGAQALSGKIIAARVADGGRDWTDAERQEVADFVAKAKAYAIEQAGIPDA